MKFTLLFLLLLPGVTHADFNGLRFEVVRPLRAEAGERNVILPAETPRTDFDCELLMKGSEESPVWDFRPGQVLETRSSKSWSTQWDGKRIPHLDLELTSPELASSGVRLLLTCDGSLRSTEEVVINPETLARKLAPSFLVISPPQK